MNFSKTLIAAALMVVFQMKAMGTLWTGTITETVTQSDRADYPVGDVYVGSYQYVSNSVDGDFGQPRWRPVAPLVVDIYHFGLDRWVNSDLFGNANLQMIVSGGEVTFFHMDAENGPSSFNFTTDSFNSLSSSYGSTVLETNVAGVLAFSAPVAANVPDRTNAGVLLAIGLTALGAATRLRVYWHKFFPKLFQNLSLVCAKAYKYATTNRLPKRVPHACTHSGQDFSAILK